MGYENLIRDLKKKKELQDLDNSFIEARIREYLQDRSIPSNKKSKEYKKIFKDLRKLLRKTYGMFRVIQETRDINFYKLIFDKINTKSILDLGCGLAPLEYAELTNAKIYATDISNEAIKRIVRYFKENNVKGKAFVFNLVDQDLSKLPKVELCLMLKLLESLELIKRNISKTILKQVNSKYFVVSFAKIALGKKSL